VKRAAAPRLRALQEWLSLVIQHEATAEVAVRSAPARAYFLPRAVRAGRPIKPNDRMSATDRLQVYNGGYLTRLIEVLASDYPALQYLLGDHGFHRLAARYTVAHPSRHANLIFFGRHLPAFVQRQRSLPQSAFATELATLEWALAEAFHAREFTPLQAARLQRIPPAQWAVARLQLNPSVRLQTCRFPVNGYYQAWLDDRAPAPPAAAATHLLVYRKDDRMWRARLDRAAFAVLQALAAGRPLGKALEAAGGNAAVGGWFQEWAADGLFVDVELRAQRPAAARRRGGAETPVTRPAPPPAPRHPRVAAVVRPGRSATDRTPDPAAARTAPACGSPPSVRAPTAAAGGTGRT